MGRAPPTWEQIMIRSGNRSKPPVRMKRDSERVVSKGRPTISGSRKISIFSAPMVTRGGCTNSGTSRSVTSSKNGTALGESRYSPSTLELIMIPLRPYSRTARSVSLRNLSPPNGTAHASPSRKSGCFAVVSAAKALNSVTMSNGSLPAGVRIQLLPKIVRSTPACCCSSRRRGISKMACGDLGWYQFCGTRWAWASMIMHT